MTTPFPAARLLLALIWPAAVLIAPTARAAEEHEMAGAAANLAAKQMGVEMQRTLEHTLAQAQLAHSIGLDVVCLCGTCPKRTITECDCGWAKQNQNAIINAVVKGMNREQIIATYRQAYGQEVLAMLPNEGFNVLAWALPYGSALAGLGAIFLVGARLLRRSRGAPAAAATPEQAGAAPAPDATAARAQLERELEDLE
ncbi:MAG: cytochrome c-type biogenesis protein CcmH [Deltaproteobacteria bacterium]|nr:cytochrome c-type biogenesis protein CcmH [Deltaproteobacteria bacterium]